jgi:hypothetical protein
MTTLMVVRAIACACPGLPVVALVFQVVALSPLPS